MKFGVQTLVVIVSIILISSVYPFVMTNNILTIDFSPSTTNLIYDRFNVSILPPPNSSLVLGAANASFKVTNIIINKSKMERFQTMFISVNLSPSTTVEGLIMDGTRGTIITNFQLTSSKKNYFFDLLNIVPSMVSNIYLVFYSSSYSPTGGHFYIISITKQVSLEKEVPENEVSVYPNPLLLANDNLKIGINLPNPSRISLAIFDSVGNIVKTIVRDNLFEEGIHVFEWDGKDDRGKEVSSGKYVVFLRTEKSQSSRTFIVIR
ncbi:MAG: T9SS type A sorting domain-containing protein [Spirochaetes bacterium]|nr:T9SS type A sorting domain-containing protein [Spirochaetota bacterium]